MLLFSMQKQLKEGLRNMFVWHACIAVIINLMYHVFLDDHLGILQ